MYGILTRIVHFLGLHMLHMPFLLDPEDSPTANAHSHIHRHLSQATESFLLACATTLTVLELLPLPIMSLHLLFCRLTTGPVDLANSVSACLGRDRGDSRGIIIISLWPVNDMMRSIAFSDVRNFHPAVP